MRQWLECINSNVGISNKKLQEQQVYDSIKLFHETGEIVRKMGSARLQSARNANTQVVVDLIQLQSRSEIIRVLHCQERSESQKVSTRRVATAVRHL